VVSFIAHYLTLYSCYASIIAYLARFFCLSPVSGSPLDIPAVNLRTETQKQALENEKFRNYIEGKLGQGKRGVSLNCVMTKLAHTSETAMAITFLIMNLSVILRQIFWSIFRFNYFLG